MTATAFAQPVHHRLPGDVSQFTLQALLDEARLLMGQEQALQYRLAAVLRELDQRASADGSPMRLTRWLHDYFGLTFGTAREKVRTARALGSLPAINGAFRDGLLSYSKVRALTRVATPDNEEVLLATARDTNAEGVEHLVRQVRQAACLGDVQAMLRSRALSTRWDASGMLLVQGRLTPEQGEIFLKALAKATEALSTTANDTADDAATDAANDATNDDSYWALRADALCQVMADSLSGRDASAPGDRHQVVVHVAAETLAASEPEPEPETKTETEPETQNAGQNVPAGTPPSQRQNAPAGTLLHPETIRRLACDGGLVTILENPSGEPLNVGRKTRAIPPATRRALVSRDRHCQFPGCSQDRYVEGHHIVHWANGGETKLSNLVLLCSRHHRAVHELGYRIRCSGLGDRADLEFVKPDLGKFEVWFQNPFVPPTLEGAPVQTGFKTNPKQTPRVL